MNRRFIAVVCASLLSVAYIACRGDELTSYGSTSPIQATGQALLTSQEPWYLTRAVQSSDAALTGATKTWAAASPSLRQLRPWGTVTMSFLCYGDGTADGDPASGSFKYEAYACRKYGSLERICSGSVTVGDVQASVLPHDNHGITLADSSNYKWAEGSGSLVTSKAWDTSVGYTTVADEVGKISWDPLGCPYVYIRVYDLSGITTVYVLMTGR